MCAGHTARTQASNQKRGGCSSGERDTFLWSGATKRCFMPLVFRNVSLLLRLSSLAERLPACHWLMEQQCLVWRKGRVPEPWADQDQNDSEENNLVIVSWFGLSNLAVEPLNTLKAKAKSFTRVTLCLLHPRCPSIASMCVKIIYILKYFSLLHISRVKLNEKLHLGASSSEPLWLVEEKLLGGVMCSKNSSTAAHYLWCCLGWATYGAIYRASEEDWVLHGACLGL